MDSDERLKEARGNAQRRIDEIGRFVLDGDNNLTELLVKAHRAGLPHAKSAAVFDALRALATEAQERFEIAINAPEYKTVSHRVQL